MNLDSLGQATFPFHKCPQESIYLIATFIPLVSKVSLYLFRSSSAVNPLEIYLSNPIK